MQAPCCRGLRAQYSASLGPALQELATSGGDRHVGRRWGSAAFYWGTRGTHPSQAKETKKPEKDWG